MNQIDASIPRWRYWNTEIDSPQSCPKCHSPLEKGNQSYLVLIKRGRESMSYIIGNDGGHFCPHCPVVVLDYEEFLEGVLAAGASQGTLFIVAGIVDWDAIPEDKRDAPIGEEDNPIPLVEFLNTAMKHRESHRQHFTTRKKRRKVKKLKGKKKKRK